MFSGNDNVIVVFARKLLSGYDDVAVALGRKVFSGNDNVTLGFYSGYDDVAITVLNVLSNVPYKAFALNKFTLSSILIKFDKIKVPVSVNRY